MVSASHSLAETVHHLSESITNAINGDIDFERIIVVTRAVATCGARLMTATSFRSDPNSPHVIRLKSSMKATISQTDNLVDIAENALQIIHENEMAVTLIGKKQGAASSKIMEMNAQVNILKMEKELEKARMSLNSARKSNFMDGNSEKTKSKTRLLEDTQTTTGTMPNKRE